MNKIDEFKDYLKTEQPNIVLLQETYLKPQHKLGIANYITYRTDRLNGKGGGTAILIQKNINHIHLPNYPTKNLEHTAIQIMMKGNKKTRIISAYQSPSKVLLEEDLDIFFKNNDSRTILGGDLNSKHQRWNCRVSNIRGKKLAKHSDHHTYIIAAPTEHTHFTYQNSDILDIFIMNNINDHYTITTDTALSSDHNPVFMTLNNWQNSIINTQQTRISWTQFSNQLKQINRPAPNITSTQELEREIQLITEEVQAAISNNTSTIIKTQPDNQLPQHIKNLIKEKNKLLKTARRTFFPPDYHRARQKTNQIREEITKYRSNQWNNTLNSICDNEEDHNAIWKLLRKTRKNINTNHPLIGPRGLVHTDNEKLESMADALEATFNIYTTPQDDPNQIATFNQYIENYISNLQNPIPLRPATEEELITQIKQLNPKKAPGPDRISNRHIKNMPTTYLKHIINIINSILKLQHFPNQWKHALIITFPKPNKNPLHPENHRPISLLNTFSKLTERIILTRLTEDIEDRNIIPNIQYGFRPNHSTEQQALRLTEIIFDTLTTKRCSSALFLDISKAFDKVWHNLLLQKMINYRINNTLIKLTHSFLKNRTFSIKSIINTSTIRSINAGVPQGAVLSPTLYNLFTADIPIHFPNTQILTFADDTAIITTSKSYNRTINYLQNTINEITQWTNQSRLQINPDKSQLIHFSKKFTHPNNDRPEDQIKINHQIIKWQNTVKYLGITFDSKLTWRPHLKTIATKAHQRFIALYPYLNKNSKLNTKTKTRLYKACIQPIMLYASTVWGQAAKTNINLIEIQQNKILRSIHNAPWYIRNNKIRKELGIKTIISTIKTRNRKKMEEYAKHHNPTLRDRLSYDENHHTARRRPKAALTYEPP